MSELLERMRQRAAELGVAGPASDAEPDFSEYAHLVPDVEPVAERDPVDIEIDEVLDRVDIIEAYIRWCGKMTPETNGKRESVMCSCPKPDHADRNPSAWINLDKGTWFCGGCQEGGDKFDIAAYHFGFPVPDYKGKDFPELRRRMAADLGYVVRTTPAGTRYVDSAANAAPGGNTDPTAPEPERPAVAAVAPAPAPEPVVGANDPDPDPDAAADPSIVPLPGVDVPFHGAEFVKIPFDEVIEPGTFLDQWMDLALDDDLPLEYYFWLGMQALGFAAGHDAVLADSPTVKGNLYLCLVGPTGLGKSRATRSLVTLLRDALPYDFDDPYSKGCMIGPTPNSAESLIDLFSKPQYDPNDPTKIVDYASVRGLVRFEELSGLVGKAARTGSLIKPVLMELYDSYDEVSSKSRGGGSTVARSPFCQVVTTTQPKAIADLLERSDEHSGFLNRWLFSFGEPRQLVAYKGTGIDPTRCTDALRDVRSWASTGRELHLTGDALELWVNFFERQMMQHKLNDDEPMLGRLDLLLKKFILLLACNVKEDVPSARTVERALALHDYVAWTYGRMRSFMSRGPFEDCRDQIIKICRETRDRTGKDPSMRDIKRGCRRFQLPLIVKVFETMIKVGELKEELQGGSRGPKVARYSYVG